MDNTYIYVQGDTPPLHLLVSSPLCVYIYMIGQYWDNNNCQRVVVGVAMVY